MKPILFNTEMVRAILEGRKTVTRRVVKPQPPEGVRTLYPVQGGAVWRSEGINVWVEIKPPHQSGDILYVREMWRPTGVISQPYAYRAAENDLHLIGEDGRPLTLKYRWRPSIHMPKEAARLFLRVTGVRVERLQEITQEDVEREGISWIKNPLLRYDLTTIQSESKRRFAPLWDSTIKPADLPRYGWEANPWVWVIEFERISKEAAVRGGGDG